MAEVGFAQTPTCCGINPGPGWQRDRRGSRELSCLQPQALPCEILGEGGHCQPLGERKEEGWSRDSRGTPTFTALYPHLLAAQTYLAAGQADDPLTPIQVLAAVACAEKSRRLKHLPPQSPCHGRQPPSAPPMPG